MRMGTVQPRARGHRLYKLEFVVYFSSKDYAKRHSAFLRSLFLLKILASTTWHAFLAFWVVFFF